MQTFIDIYRYRFVISNLVGKNFKALYRNMALGFLWSLLNPLILITVLSIVWTKAFPVLGIHSFVSFVVVAYIPFLFFQYSIVSCTSSIVAHASLVKKVAFPRQILPISAILSSGIHFLIQMPLILVSLLIFPPPGDCLSLHVLWLPAILSVHVGLAVGTGLLVSSLSVVYRDVQYVVESTLLILFWASPIIYDHTMLRTSANANTSGANAEVLGAAPEAGHSWLYYVYYMNPLAGILDAYRNVLYYGTHPDAVTSLMALGVTIVAGVVGVRVFWIYERQFADLV